MAETERHRDLRRLLAAAARAHHEATGGPNAEWAIWYAEYLHADIGPLIGGARSVDVIAEWLVRADEQYTTEGPDGSWPGQYATWFLEWVSVTDE